MTEKLGHLFQGNFSVILPRYCRIFPQLFTSFKFKARIFTVATETANLIKPPESTQDYLQASKTIHNHPKTSKNIYNYPKPTITTQSHTQSARIDLEIAITSLKTSTCTWKHTQSFTKHLRSTLVLTWNSAQQQKFNFFISEGFC